MLSNGYILILIWVGMIGLLSVLLEGLVYRMEFVNGKRVRRVTPIFVNFSTGNLGRFPRECW